MKKLKIYLDTSVISHLDAKDTPDKMADTLELWEEIRNRMYETCVSDVTIEEIEKASDIKKATLYNFLGQIPFERIAESEESLTLTDQYIRFGILSTKSRDDCRHIAVATLFECDFIVSWNFKHFVNIKTIDKVCAVNRLLGYKEIKIAPPSMLLGGE